MDEDNFGSFLIFVLFVVFFVSSCQTKIMIKRMDANISKIERSLQGVQK